jgi:hypothetical protein
MKTESVRDLSDGEQLVVEGLSSGDSEDPRERTSEARSLGFDQDYDNTPRCSQR